MNDILEQLELNQTFFIQLALFAVVFLILSQVYFKPFLKLFDIRHQKTVRDREMADKLMADAKEKLESYRKRMADERSAAKKEYETVLAEAKKHEAEFLAKAREEAKKITQEAVDAISKQRGALKAQLEKDVEAFASTISEKLLSRKP